MVLGRYRSFKLILEALVFLNHLFHLLLGQLTQTDGLGDGRGNDRQKAYIAIQGAFPLRGAVGGKGRRCLATDF